MWARMARGDVGSGVKRRSLMREVIVRSIRGVFTGLRDVERAQQARVSDGWLVKYTPPFV